MLKKIMSTLIATLFMTGMLSLTAGCNTIHGVGADIEKGGQEIKGEANEHR